MDNPILSRVYIHIPFCKSKCDYCAFYSLPSPDERIVRRYFIKLREDISRTLFTAPVKSIYVGGGTPGYLSERYLSELVEILRKLNVSEEAEISIECNPDSLTVSKIKIISSFFNRVSLGVQTFDTHFRKVIGRKGSIEIFNDIVRKFKTEGIENISSDLIYGIPGQSVESFKSDLDRILDCGLKHFSAYSLTMEENSLLKGVFSESELENAEEISAIILENLPEMISDRGFFRYEISNYSQKGFECRHNFSTWFGSTYAGFGPSASSFDGFLRWTNPEMNDWFSGKSPELDSIPNKNRVLEIFAMGLRTIMPWEIIESKNSRIEITSSFGISFYLEKSSWNQLSDKLDELNKDELIKVTRDNRNNKILVSSTDKGMAFWNDLALCII